MPKLRALSGDGLRIFAQFGFQELKGVTSQKRTSGAALVWHTKLRHAITPRQSGKRARPRELASAGGGYFFLSLSESMTFRSAGRSR